MYIKKYRYFVSNIYIFVVELIIEIIIIYCEILDSERIFL